MRKISENKRKTQQKLTIFVVFVTSLFQTRFYCDWEGGGGGAGDKSDSSGVNCPSSYQGWKKYFTFWDHKGKLKIFCK